jgi:hypothetical protein
MLRQLTILLLLHVPAFAQIGSKVSQGKLFGVWQNSEMGFQMVLILNQDYTGEFDGEVIKYTVSGNGLTISQSGQSTTYTYLLKENSLTLAGGDLDKELTFTRQGPASTSLSSKSTPAVSTTQSKISNSADLLGAWSGNGETIEFKKDGMCNYLGQTYPYETSQGYVSLLSAQGKAVFQYTIVNNQLTLMANGRQVTYSKGKPAATSSSNGNVSQELAGKWCYVNVYSNNSGGSSTSKCIVLNADGTYEYSGESSRSASTPDAYGGTSSQSADRGTWWVQGDRIFYNSQSQGQGSYQFVKRNHPRNGDPMIVLDGEAYVTFYNKQPWRN